jgi:hypothetical protein
MAKTNAKGGASGRASKVRGAPKPRAKRHGSARSSESTIAIIDRLLATRVPIKVNGKVTRIPAAEAIVLQLLQKAMAGSGRAWRPLLKYRDFASRRSDKAIAFSFVDSDYTAAFANSLRKDENG